MTTKREHDAWLRVQQDRGWRYGEEYSEDAKTDPRMVPFESLTVVEENAVEVVAEPFDPENTPDTPAEQADDAAEMELVPVPEDVMQELSDIGQEIGADAPQEGEFNG